MTSPHSATLEIKKGHCYLVDMNPPRRSKPGKVRPVIVVQSEDTIAIGSPGIVIVPITSDRVEPNILRVPLTPSPHLQIERPSDILLDQLHTIDRTLFITHLGEVPLDTQQKIEDGIRFLLNF